MKRFTQITIPCLLIVVVAFTLARVGASGAAKASTLSTVSSRTCGSWNIVHSPIPPKSQRSSLSGVAAISSNDVWVVGSYFISRFQTNTLAEHWNGSRWSIVPSPDPGQGTSRTDDELFSVAAVSSNDVWAIGKENNLPLIEHWDGTQWSVVASPATSSSVFLTDIAAVTSNDVWIVGRQITSNIQDLTFTEHWDGTQWSIVPSPSRGTAGSDLTSVTALASNDIWAVGWNYGTAGAEQTLTEHWDGTQWSIVASPNVPNVHSTSLGSVTAISSNDVWAVGFSIIQGTGSFEGQTLTEHWNGTAWQIVTSPNPDPGDTLGYVAAVSTNNIWATGGSFTSGTSTPPFIEHWDGTSWQVVSSPPTTPPGSIGDVSVVPGSSDLWTAGVTTPAAHPNVSRALIEYYC